MKKNNKYLGNKDSIDIKEFILKKNEEQDKAIEDILNKLYEEEVETKASYIEKVLNLAYEDNDNEIYLPHSLCVKKDGNKLFFSFVNNKNTHLFIIFFLLFLFLSGFATYTGIKFLNSANLNIDTDGDGIADLNIDLDGDGVCDINCDTDGDGKPDLNIDYLGNRKALFNKNTEDGIENKMNQKDENGVCKLNCDTNDDGWPDTNIDIDGDGVPDINVDTDNDGIPDTNIDVDKDMVPDINVDDDNDGVCDRNCTFVSNKDGDLTIGDNDISADSAKLIARFEDGNNVRVTDLYPTDQQGNVTKTVPDVKFSVENTTNQVLYYTINWLNIVNTFESENFQFSVWSDYSGYKTDFTTAPFSDGILKDHIAIAPHTKQSYTVSFRLRGTGTEQNYDQGKTFKGKLTVKLEENK